MNILLVEDSDLYAKLIIEHHLMGSNINVDRVEYLKDTLAATKQYDTILLDLTLPNSRGAETVKAVHDRFPDIPIIVITGDDDRETKLKAYKNGARDYIVKQKMTREGLLRIIEDCFETVNNWRTMKKAEQSFASLRIR